ncbi:hypothetical protein AB4K20DRAFT_1914834 [Rhizopus microsporus]
MWSRLYTTSLFKISYSLASPVVLTGSSLVLTKPWSSSSSGPVIAGFSFSLINPLLYNVGI